MKHDDTLSTSLREQTRRQAYALRNQAIAQVLAWLWRQLSCAVRAVVQRAAVSPTARSEPRPCR